METAKPTKFIKLLAKRLLSNGCVEDIQKLKVKRVLKAAVSALPDGPLKDTVNKRFGFYVKQLRSIFEKKKSKVSAKTHEKRSFPYNLYAKENDPVTGTVDDDQLQQTYGTLLCRKLEKDPVEKLAEYLTKIDDENQDTVLLNLTCGTTSYLGLLKTMHLYFLVVQPKAENIIRDYGKTGNAKDKKTEENARCRTLCDKMKNFLSVCHLRHSAIQKPEAPAYPYSYWDLLSTILAVFIDVFLLSNRKSKKQEQASRRLCNLVCYLTEDNPVYRLDALIQMSKVHTNTDLLLPYVRRTFETKPKTGDYHHYLKYVLALRTVCDVSEETAESDEITTLRQQTGKTVPAPKHFLDWLGVNNEDILDEMPVEDKRFKKSHVTKFILEEAEDKLLSLLADILTNKDEETEDQVPEQKKKKTKKNKKPKGESKKKAEEEITPDSELFFIDTGDNEEMMEQANISDSELFFLDTGGKVRMDGESKMENHVPKKKDKASKKKKNESDEVPATEAEDQVVKKKKKANKEALKEDQDTNTEDQVSKKKKKKKKQKVSEETIGLEDRQDSQLFFLDTVGGKQKQDQDTKAVDQVLKKKEKSAKKKKKESKEATNIADENQETEVYYIDTSAGSWHKQNDIDIEDKEESDNSLEITDITFAEQTMISSDDEEIVPDEMDIRDMQEDDEEEKEEEDMEVKNGDSDKENVEDEIMFKESLEENTIQPMDINSYKNTSDTGKNSEAEVLKVSEENQVDIESETEVVDDATGNDFEDASDDGEDVCSSSDDGEDDEDIDENVEGIDADDAVKPDETDDNESEKGIGEGNDETDSIEAKTNQEQTEEMLACFVNKSPTEYSDEMEVTLLTPDRDAESVSFPEVLVSGKSTRQRKVLTNSQDTTGAYRSSEEKQMFSPSRTPSTDKRKSGKESSSDQRNKGVGMTKTPSSLRTRSSSSSPEKQSSVRTLRNRSPEKQTPVDKPRNRSPEKQTPVDKPRNRSPEKQTPVNKPRNRSPEKQSSVDKPRNTSPEKRSTGMTPSKIAPKKQSAIDKLENTSLENQSSAVTPSRISPKKRSSVASPTNGTPKQRLFKDVNGNSGDTDSDQLSPRKVRKRDVHEVIQEPTPEKKRRMRGGEVTEAAPSESSPRKSRTGTLKTTDQSPMNDWDTSSGSSEYGVFEFESDEEIIIKSPKAVSDGIWPKTYARQKSPKTGDRLKLLKTDDRLKSPKTDDRLKSPKTDDRLKSPKTDDRLKSPKTDGRQKSTKTEDKLRTPNSMKGGNKSPLSAKKSQTPRNNTQHKDYKETVSSSDEEEENSLHLRRSSRTPQKRQIEASSSSKGTKPVASSCISSPGKQLEESVFEVTNELSGEIGNEVIPDSNDSDNESVCEQDFPLLSSPIKESPRVPSSCHKTLHTKQTLQTEVNIDSQSPANYKKNLSPKTPNEKFTSVKSRKSQPSPRIIDQPSPSKSQTSRKNSRSSTSVVSSSVNNGVVSAVSKLTAANLAAMASPAKRYPLRETRKRRESGTSDVSDYSVVTRSRKCVSKDVDPALDSSKKHSMTGNESASVSSSPDRTQGRKRLQTLDEDSSNLMMVTDKNFRSSNKETQTPSSRRKSCSVTSVESPRKSERRRYSLRGKD